MIEIKDNFLDKEDFDKIKEVYNSPNIPWAMGDILYDDEINSEVSVLDNLQFINPVYSMNQPVSQLFDYWIPILKKTKAVALYSIKINLNPRTPKIYEHGLHTDTGFMCKTGVFYINSNDGYTSFEDGTKVESVENRFVSFNSDMKHSGTSCTNQKYRLVMNINYFEAKFINLPHK